MARVLLIGNGPLPTSNPQRLGFSQLRTWHFLQALRRGGHDVHLVLLGEEAGEEDVLQLSMQGGEWIDLLTRKREEVSPDVVVSAGPYHPARAAALTVGEEPLWVDVPGDPFAEAQAKSAHKGEHGAAEEMLAAYAPALQRADSLSAISPAQRYALVGQLGVLGRLVDAPLGHPWVHSLPAVVDFGDLPWGAARSRQSEEELVVALSGGYNTWLDGDTLLDGLHLAMDKVPGLRVISTGGEIPGHHSATYDGFRALAMAGPHARRFTFHGWVPHGALPQLLSAAHVGVCLDRLGFEPELGTRTRVLFFLHQGLSVLATTGGSLCRELGGLRMLEPVRQGSPQALADALVDLYRAGTDPADIARAQAYVKSRYSLDEVMAPLLTWVESPRRVRPAKDMAAQLSAELARTRGELAAVYETPTWKMTGAADRLLKRGSKRLDRLLGREDWEG